jgi:hydroxymethylbilane synthase
MSEIAERPPALRVGTRASPLALWQTRDFLAAHHPFLPDAAATPTPSRNSASRPPATRSRTACSPRSAARACSPRKSTRHFSIAASISRSIRSRTSRPRLPPGIVLACTLKREDARDCLLPGPALPAESDPADPLRRAAAGRGHRHSRRSAANPSCCTPPRPERGRCSAAMCRPACASCGGRVPPPRCWPMRACAASELEAPGSVAIEAEDHGSCRRPGHRRRDRARRRHANCANCWHAIEDPEARAVASAERALLAALDGSCRTPIGGHARI